MWPEVRAPADSHAFIPVEFMILRKASSVSGFLRTESGMRVLESADPHRAGGVGSSSRLVSPAQPVLQPPAVAAGLSVISP